MRIFVFFMLMVSANSVLADYCWMTGCKGMVGYILVPEQHYRYTKITGHTNITPDGNAVKGGENLPFTRNLENKVFKESGLPEVNTEVTINKDYTELLTTYDDPKELLKTLSRLADYMNSWAPYVKKWNDDKTGVIETLQMAQIGLGRVMQSGTKVKILGYRLLKSELAPFASSSNNQFRRLSTRHLLALVQVTYEPWDQEWNLRHNHHNQVYKQYRETYH